VQREPFLPVQNWSEPSTLPAVLSFEPPLAKRHEVSLRNTEVPVSKEKLRSALSMPTLSVTVIEPGLLL
jgi:hypothetical protein